MDPGLPWLLPGTPDEIRRRLAAEFVVIGSVWFPTAAELDAWLRSPAPLYVRFLPDDGFEIGPRLASPSAARLCPALRGCLVRADGGTRFDGRLRYTPMTAVLLAGAGTVVVAWFAWIVWLLDVADPLAFRWVILWVVALLLFVAAAGGGWITGARAWRDHASALRAIASSPPVEGEDW